jgi:hypothetical protein
MQFAIATVDYFQQHGFDCADWRKSIDQTQAIVHFDFAKTLIPNLENDSNVIIYECPSQSLDDVLNSSSWMNEEK